MKRFLVISTCLILASCGGCKKGSDGSSNQGTNSSNNGTNNAVVEPYIAEVCDSDRDEDQDGRAGCDDPDCRMAEPCLFSPPEPSSVATNMPTSGITGFRDRMAFLFEGENPVQRGVESDSIGELTIGAASGLVREPGGEPITGAAVTVLGSPQFGRTYSRSDGRFDLVFDAGSDLVVRVEKSGYTPVFRTVRSGWQDVRILDDVVLTPISATGTPVDFSETTFVEGSVAEDDDGQRRTAVVVPAGTEAKLVMPNGERRPLEEMTVRVTEVTVGEDGPNAMPGRLPGTSRYTFAAEFTVDEAVTAGAEHVEFDRPVFAYVDNFLGFEPGSVVPVGWFDRTNATWKGSQNGVVVRIDDITEGQALLSAGEEDLAIGDEELSILADHYEVGDELWRVPLRHFSTFDKNWPGLFPPGMFAPLLGADPFRSSCDGPTEAGSIINCNSQTLREVIPLHGTPLTLAYQSGRVPGRIPSVTIPLRDREFPETLRSVRVEMDVAGVHYEAEFQRADVPPVQVWTWNRRDAFGRYVQGAVPAEVEITYVFDASYAVRRAVGRGLGPARSALEHAEDGESDFAQYTTADGADVRLSRSTVVISRSQLVKLGGWDVTKEKLGGWTLAPQHRFDPQVPALHFGSGEDLVADEDDRTLDVLGGVIQSVLPEPPPDGEPAEGAFLGAISDIAVGPDGTVYFCGGLSVARVRRIAPDGTVHTVIPYVRLITEEKGDGRPASEAELLDVSEIEVGPDGHLYLESRHGIWRIEDGILHRLVGGGETPLDELPPGGPATELDFEYEDGVTFDVGRDGSLYFETGTRIYRVMPGGGVFQIAGSGESCPDGQVCDDGELATVARLHLIEKIAVASDGSLVFVSRDQSNATAYFLRRIQTDGRLETYEGFDIDGLEDFELHPSSDEVFIAAKDTPSLRGITVAHVLEDGTTEPAVGSLLDDEAERSPSLEVHDGDPASTPRSATAVAMAPNGQIVYSDGFQIVKVSELLPTWTGSEYQIPGGDGRSIYRFHADGRHDLTHDAATGTVMWDFVYDDQNLLTQVVDRESDTTTIGRDASGNIESITGPYGVTWTILVNSEGYMTALISPENEEWSFEYANGGLLTSMTAPTGYSWSFDYDERGRLSRDQQSTLAQAYEPGRRTITFTSGEGRTTEYVTSLVGDDVAIERTGNVESTRRLRSDGHVEQTRPDGTVLLNRRESHPSLGYMAAYSGFSAIYSPGGKSLEVTRSQTGTVADVDPLTLESWEEVTTTGLRQVVTSWDGASATLSRETGGGRTTALMLDTLGRLERYAPPGVAPYVLTYDEHGRVTEMSQSGRMWIFDYDSDGYPSAVQLPDGSVRFSRDLMGRTTTGTRADGTTVDIAWDGMSNPVSISPPERSAYTTTYNERQQPTTFTTPLGDFQFRYNADFQIDSLTYPDGRVATVDYDGNARPVRLVEPGRTLDLAFHEGQPGDFDGTGQLLAAQSDGGPDIEFAWDGFLLTDSAWLGEVSGEVTWNFGEQLALTSIAVNGVEVPYEYDADGAITAAGNQEVRYEDGTFRVSRRKHGSVTTTREYDEYGQLTRLRTTAGGALLDIEYTYDDLGRISQIVETDQGMSKTVDYTYDMLGRLVEVQTDGVVTGSYTYDANGNRTSSLDVASATYGDDDAMLTYGNRTYTYTSGQLATMTEGGVTTTYDYGMFGELRSVDDGTRRIGYVHDAFNRRVGKRLDGNLVQGFLYQDTLNPAAELNPDGTVKSRFVYATRGHVPDHMIRDGREYQIITDHLGSVRYVVDTTDNSVIQRLEYDEFGQVLADSNPGFQPFGFAGGLYDAQTGMTRFGVRDYDPSTGRWTARDPIAFGGGQTNLWSYVRNSPVNLIDPDGRNPILFAALAGLFVGVGTYLAVTPRECWTIQGGLGWGLGGAIGGAALGAWAGLASLAASGGSAASTAANASLASLMFGVIGGPPSAALAYAISNGIDPHRTPTLAGMAQSAGAGTFLGPLALFLPALLGGLSVAGLPAFTAGLANRSAVAALDRNLVNPNGGAPCRCN